MSYIVQATTACTTICKRFGLERSHVRCGMLGFRLPCVVRPSSTRARLLFCKKAGRLDGQAWVSSSAIREVTTEEELREKGDTYFVDDSRSIILYDGVCNMCNSAVNFVLDRDEKHLFRFAALQSEAGKALLVRSGRPADYLESVILATKDASYEKSEAILQIAKLLDLPLAETALLAPLFARDSLYDTVAQNRYKVLGKLESCRLTDDRFKDRFLSA